MFVHVCNSAIVMPPLELYDAIFTLSRTVYFCCVSHYDDSRLVNYNSLPLYSKQQFLSCSLRKPLISKCAVLPELLV